jgi:hypothetical protein
VAYYSQNEITEHISFVVTSDCLKHDTVAVHLFQSKLCSFLSGKLKNLTKIYYLFDGAASHYRSRKNFINLYYHTDDFGKDTERHFFAMSHGKGACGGNGGTIKRLATEASLQNLYKEHIMTPRQLYKWDVVKILLVTCEYCTAEDNSKEMMMSGSEWFRKALSLPGTQKIY